MEWDREDVTKQIRRWFVDHVATVNIFRRGEREIQEILWKKPGTGVNSILYIIKNRTLCVQGDLGEAVYRWSDVINLPFLAGCYLDYFAEKCEASECGRGFKEWNELKAREYLDDWLSQLAEERECNVSDLLTHEHEDVTASELRSACDHEHEFYIMLDSHYGLFGSDWGESSWGEDIAIRCIYHNVGLKMAHEQLGDGPYDVVSYTPEAEQGLSHLSGPIIIGAKPKRSVFAKIAGLAMQMGRPRA